MSSAATTPLLLTPRQAAEALAISERTLWTLTDRGDVPCVRIGRLVRYPATALAQWIADRAMQTCR